MPRIEDQFEGFEREADLPLPEVDMQGEGEEKYCDVCGIFYDKEDPCPFH